MPKKTKKTKDKWVNVNPLEVLTVTKDGKMFLFDEPMTQIDLKNLKAEVKALKNFKVWRIFQETLKHKAIEKGFINSTEWEHTLSGKMMVHSLGILKSIVDVLDRYPQR